MADELVIPPMPAIEPDAAPSTDPQPRGTAAFVADIDKMIGGGEAEKPDASAAAPDKPKPPDKAAPKPAAPDKTKPAAAAPPEREEDLAKDPVKLRLAHKKLKEEYEGFKGNSAKELDSVRGKLATLEKKRFWTEDDEARSQALARKTSELEAELYSRDYKASPEFKDKFAARWDKKHKDAVDDVRGMQVKYRDGEEEKLRPATEHDFERIRALGSTRAEQRKAAKEMFGEDAGTVLEYTAQLRSIEEEANTEIATKRKNFDADREKQAGNWKTYQQTFENARSEVDRALSEKYPQFFGTNGDDPEDSAAFKQGMDFVDETLKIAENIPVQDRAARNAIIRHWAAAFPRMALQVKNLKAQLAARDEELGKYRASDPGEGGGGPAGDGTGAERPKNTDAMAAEYDNLKG